MSYHNNLLNIELVSANASLLSDMGRKVETKHIAMQDVVLVLLVTYMLYPELVILSYPVLINFRVFFRCHKEDVVEGDYRRTPLECTIQSSLLFGDLALLDPFFLNAFLSFFLSPCLSFFLSFCRSFWSNSTQQTYLLSLLSTVFG